MIVHPDVEAYLQKMTPESHPVLQEMESLAARRNFPIVGPLVGRLLYLLIEFGHVHTVLECGSGFGYSAIWMALALPENGSILCIEYEEKNLELARQFAEKAEVAHKIKFVQGDALEVVKSLQETYDFILNDVNKPQYPMILPDLIRLLRVGGMLVTDNVLWKGQVAQANPDEKTRAIQTYNQALFQEPGLWTSIVPLRDGVALSVKLKRE
ncbi:MAG: O-methyltransferase [Calditrichaeota bacterium]|nr:MAG: O-methyltransferase [Calditrichota bacterium]